MSSHLFQVTRLVLPLVTCIHSQGRLQICVKTGASICFDDADLRALNAPVHLIETETGAT